MSDPRKELNGMVMDCYSHPKGGWSATVHFSKEVPVGTQLSRADLEAENKRLKRDAEELSFLYGDLLHWTERAVGNGNANSDIEDAWSRYEDWMKARAALERKP